MGHKLKIRFDTSNIVHDVQVINKFHALCTATLTFKRRRADRFI
jgi:hypothetical protein